MTVSFFSTLTSAMCIDLQGFFKLAPSISEKMSMQCEQLIKKKKEKNLYGNGVKAMLPRHF